MAGIYIHIPFCKKRCSYCDFYKTIDAELADTFLVSLEKEMELQRDYLEQKEVETIYFGGGTPTVLSAQQIGIILEKLHATFNIKEDTEITIEANPDDIKKTYTKSLAKTGINRISLGIQSWNDEILKLLNRRHNSEDARKALEHIFSSGIDNISADLIYGIPGMSLNQWKENLQITLDYDIKHLSAYHLTIEEHTVFGKMKKNNELREIDEEESEKQFNVLIDECEKNGFIQYEISNFCKEGYFSIHNTNYWRREPYLGLGPSAHSFNGESRQWNIADLNEYIKLIEKDEVPATIEILNVKDMFNEYVMTSLRTMWGIDLDYVEDKINKESRDYLN
ncbi:MAG TPA: coproporphyrinogen III oxidase, partial [Bacteroidales bacterium]|nr:coproporphyrinogen III oxidase [Bacteroidales bacterium]